MKTAQFPISIVALLGLVASLVSVVAPAAAGSHAADVVDDFEDAGLVSDTEWESPLNGFTIEWSGPWAVNESMTGPTPFFMGTWEEARVPVFAAAYGDHIDLWNEDDSAVLRITDRYGDPAGMPSASEYVESTMSKYPLDSTSAQILRETTDEKVLVVHLVADTRGEVYISHNEFVVPKTDDGDRLLWTELLAPIDSFERAHESVVDDVSNSAATFGDILNASEIVDAAQANDTLISPADLGIASPTSWDVPFSGASVTWSSNWVFDGSPNQWSMDENSQSTRIRLLGGSGSPTAHQVTISSRPNPEGLTARQVAYRLARSEVDRTNNEVLLRRHGDSSVVLTRMPSDDNPVVIYDEIFITGDGEFIVQFNLSFRLDSTESDYPHFAGEITVDGVPVGEALIVDEIIDAAENAAPVTIIGTNTLSSFQDFRNSLVHALDAYGEAGMIWLNQYESPNHGYAVTWTMEGQDYGWILNEPVDSNGDVIPAVTSSPDGADSLSIWNRSTSTLVRITSQTTDEAPIDVVTAHLDFCDDLETATCEIVLTTNDDDSAAHLVLIETDDGRTVFMYVGGAMIDRDTFQMVVLQAKGDWLTTMYPVVQDTVSLDGDPLPLLFDEDEIASLEP